MILIQKQNLLKIISYLFTKLAGAGFTLFLFFTYLFLASGFDKYKFVESISSWNIWIIIFGYGVICSMMIDFLQWKIPRINNRIKVLLYIVAGYSFFLIMGINVFAFIAGTIGALCSLLFYFGTYLSDRSKGTKFAFAILVPLFFIILLNVDFTEKVKWNEVRDDSSYTASFEYFNGKHEIPIKVQANQTAIISIEFINQNGGGHGYHVLNEKDKLVGMTEVQEGTMKVNAEDTGVYRVVVKGDDIRGRFTVTWKIDKTH
ncbi:hypothetical protein [Neobacillus niacini]|uniref:hypothetical protein n=1 Tax=Neobacillus niacini TaxID=86668 RepID=UPI0005EF3C8A|nr:hypothetical protein [Neobacillus niacini]